MSIRIASIMFGVLFGITFSITGNGVSAADRSEKFWDLARGATANAVREASGVFCDFGFATLAPTNDASRQDELVALVASTVSSKESRMSDAECLSLYWRMRLCVALLDVKSARPEALGIQLSRIDPRQLPHPWDRLTRALIDRTSSKPRESGVSLKDLQTLMAEELDAELVAEIRSTTPQPAAVATTGSAKSRTPAGPAPRPSPARVERVPNNQPGVSQNPVGSDDGDDDCANAANTELVTRAIERRLKRKLSPDERREAVAAWCAGRSIETLARNLLSAELKVLLERELTEKELLLAWKLWERRRDQRLGVKTARDASNSDDLPDTDVRSEILREIVVRLRSPD